MRSRLLLLDSPKRLGYTSLMKTLRKTCEKIQFLVTSFTVTWLLIAYYRTVHHTCIDHFKVVRFRPRQRLGRYCPPVHHGNVLGDLKHVTMVLRSRLRFTFERLEGIQVISDLPQGFCREKF